MEKITNFQSGKIGKINILWPGSLEKEFSGLDFLTYIFIIFYSRSI